MTEEHRAQLCHGSHEDTVRILDSCMCIAAPSMIKAHSEHDSVPSALQLFGFLKDRMDRAPSEVTMRSSTRSDPCRPGTGSTVRASPGQSPGLGRLASNSSMAASMARALSGLSDPCSAAHIGIPSGHRRPGSRGSNRGLSLPANGSVRL
jgi:hypothetical protein